MYELGGKRLLDALVAALLLLLLSPLLLLVALAVRLALGRPLLFRQWRAGRHGRGFALVKFRSMRTGEGDDAARLSRFGRALRASALDELPQLWQVLRGQMSLVGPRPLPLPYLPLYDVASRRRLACRPGLCGAAQAAGRNDVPWPQRLALDAAYAEAPPRLWRDLVIIARCLRVLLTRKGARLSPPLPPARKAA